MLEFTKVFLIVFLFTSLSFFLFKLISYQISSVFNLSFFHLRLAHNLLFFEDTANS
ncbi:unnamed protein product [Meloidogyne enterolobii]|uniref:Uncharacterized protein n=1 Tax=Meloidogyne enterolobii TaxID=390850 RepID=A0ACB0XZT8_MELEN